MSNRKCPNCGSEEYPFCCIISRKKPPPEALEQLRRRVLSGDWVTPGPLPKSWKVER